MTEWLSLACYDVVLFTLTPWFNFQRVLETYHQKIITYLVFKMRNVDSIIANQVFNNYMADMKIQ